MGKFTAMITTLQIHLFSSGVAARDFTPSDTGHHWGSICEHGTCVINLAKENNWSVATCSELSWRSFDTWSKISRKPAKSGMTTFSAQCWQRIQSTWTWSFVTWSKNRYIYDWAHARSIESSMSIKDQISTQKNLLEVAIHYYSFWM